MPTVMNSVYCDQVSEKALDYKIWQTLFGREIPYKPTYLPNTKLARLVSHIKQYT